MLKRWLIILWRAHRWRIVGDRETRQFVWRRYNLETGKWETRPATEDAEWWQAIR